MCIRYILGILLGWCLLLTSCQFDDTNLDPVRLSEASLDELFPIALLQTYRNINSIGGRVTGIVVQHFKGTDAQPLAYDQYLIDERTLDEFWKTGLYSGAMRDCFLLVEKARAEGKGRYLGIGQILLAHNLGMATSFWGDVPFSEAFGGPENLYPSYDTQRDIYEQITHLLEAAVEQLSQSQDTSYMAVDLIFGGNAAAWQKTAYALLARYSLHQSKRKVNAITQALTYLERGGLAVDFVAPTLYYQDQRNGGNPLRLYLEERADQMALGNHLVDLLAQTEDPRLDAFGVFDGTSYLFYEAEQAVPFWSRLATPIPLIAAAEVQFIRSEALLRVGNVAAAEEALQAAVRLHFEQMDLDIYSSQPWYDNHINFTDCPDFDCQLQRIMEQKYIALFVQGAHQAWVDYRRTGVPTLQVPDEANSSFNPGLVVPRRYLYPISERRNNPEAYQQAIDRQGGHFQDMEVWLFR